MDVLFADQQILMRRAAVLRLLMLEDEQFRRQTSPASRPQFAFAHRIAPGTTGSFRRPEVTVEKWFQPHPAPPDQVIAAPGLIHEPTEMKGCLAGDFMPLVTQVHIIDALERPKTCRTHRLQFRGSHAALPHHRIDNHVAFMEAVHRGP